MPSLKTSNFEFPLARIYYPRPSVEELLKEMKHGMSFIVGRNPMERLGIDTQSNSVITNSRL